MPLFCHVPETPPIQRALCEPSRASLEYKLPVACQGGGGAFSLLMEWVGMKRSLLDDLLCRLSAQSSLFHHHLPNSSICHPGSVHVGNSVMTDTWQNLSFPHYGLRPQVLRLETLFTPSTSAFQVPKFCCCGLLFYTSQPCCFMAFEKQSQFCHCSRIWGGSGNMCRFQTVIFTQKLQSLLCHEN